MPDFRISKVSDIARNAKTFLSKESNGQVLERLETKVRGKRQELERLERSKRQVLEQVEDEFRSVLPSFEHYKDQPESLRYALKHVAEQQKTIIKNQELRIFRLKEDNAQLKRKLRTKTGKEPGDETPSGRLTPPNAGDEPEVGALPDFLIIGAQKGGTTTLYHLLTQHPYVERSALKEVNLFDKHFEEGTEWYRQCFPQPKWKDGRKTLTGEASPNYLFSSQVPERMAEVIPQARLIALLRNPVDRVYSNYWHNASRGHELRTLEDIMKAKETHYLSKGVYVDQLVRWSKFFSKEQMLVLKSEDFFERPREILNIVFDFLDLPDWEPEASMFGEIRNRGRYEEGMDPATRRRLEEYFEPHNKRLYDFLGVDFGW
jgi:sulfotransferase family protein